MLMQIQQRIVTVWSRRNERSDEHGRNSTELETIEKLKVMVLYWIERDEDSVEIHCTELREMANL